MTMRCFIAIDIDDIVREEIQHLQEDIQAQTDLRPGAVKWVHPESLHLTLKFLGETADARVVDLCRAVEIVAQRHPPFPLDLNRLGHFGRRSARVLWLGSQDPNQALLDFQKDLETELEQHGWPHDGRPFSAHLTLCRIKQPSAGQPLIDASRQLTNCDCGCSPIDTVTVYQSELSKQGPLYTPLGHFPLTR